MIKIYKVRNHKAYIISTDGYKGVLLNDIIGYYIGHNSGSWGSCDLSESPFILKSKSTNRKSGIYRHRDEIIINNDYYNYLTLISDKIIKKINDRDIRFIKTYRADSNKTNYILYYNNKKFVPISELKIVNKD